MKDIVRRVASIMRSIGGLDDKTRIHAEADMQTPAVNLNCREFEVNKWVISEFIVKRLVPVVGVKPFSLDELLLMVSTVCWLKPTHIFEWGTNVGVSARVFYETIRHFDIRCEIHSVDLPDDRHHVEHPGEGRGALVRDIKEVKLYQGDGALTALDLWKSAGNKSAPLFFLDGDHSYESVKRELGLIHGSIGDASCLIHDSFFQSEESGYNVGPFLAVRDFLSNVPEKFRHIDAHLGLAGMTLYSFFCGNNRELTDAAYNSSLVTLGNIRWSGS